MRRAVDYVPRRALSLVMEALEDTRVVVVNGARQVGKSTLAEVALREVEGGRARFLDDPATREAAAEDPVGFLDHDGLLLLDEVQRVPDLWLAIKHTVDRDPAPGRFLLTGSARLLALRSLPDSLPGRSETIELWPLSQGEIHGEPDGFIDAAFAHGAGLAARMSDSALRKQAYLSRLAAGGYPEAIRRDSARRRAKFFEGYVSDIILRDVKQVADIARSGDMRRLIQLLAAQTGGLLKYERLAGELGVPATTVRSYVEILETIFLVRMLPGWSASATKRAVATPKVIFQDSGLARYLTHGAAPDSVTGGLVETFALGELARQLTWNDTPAQLYHYRDRDQYEVDGILESNSGAVIGVEVKSSETVRGDDFRALRILQRRLGERFHAGFVLHCGSQPLRFGERLAALPLSALWTTPAPGR